MKDPFHVERLTTYIGNYLETWAHLKGITAPSSDLIGMYVRLLGSEYELAELQEACDYSFERYKAQRHFLAPSEIRELIEENRRQTPRAGDRGPLKVSDANLVMLESFLKAFRESGLKGKELEAHLNQVVEENYDRLGCKAAPIICKRCQDRGYVRLWFVVYAGLVDRHQRDAQGKMRTYREHGRVPHAPYWEQEHRPDFQAPAGQQLADGVCRCQCRRGEQFSFPRAPGSSEPGELPL